MGVQNEIDRLNTAKTNIAAAIKNHGVDVPSTLSIDGYADKINEIVSTPFVGATDTSDGSAGLVPQPKMGQGDYYLKGDGSWSDIPVFVVKLKASGTSCVADKTFNEIVSAFKAGSIVICQDIREDMEGFYYLEGYYEASIRFYRQQGIDESNYTFTRLEINDSNKVNFLDIKLTGIPSGGSSKQILSKATDTDYDVEWADAPKSLPAGGTEGYVLTKKSDATNDVLWASSGKQYVYTTQLNVDDWASATGTDGWSGYSQTSPIQTLEANTPNMGDVILSPPFTISTTNMGTNTELASALALINVGGITYSTSDKTVHVRVNSKPSIDIPVVWYGREIPD